MANSQQIEDRIDREITGAIALRGNGATFAMAPTNMNELMEFAKMMSVSGECVRMAFRNKPGACLAVAMQAFRTGFDPFAVANKAFIVNDQLAYESQYIHALLNTSGHLESRLRPTYEGQGPTRKCTIEGWIKGEEVSFEYTSPEVAAIPVKNSPLWKSDPDQQLFYYASRAWGRRYLPEVLLGITSSDEFPDMIDVTPPPRPQRGDFEKPTVVEHEAKYFFTDLDGVVQEFDYVSDALTQARDLMEAGAKRSDKGLEAAWENIAPLISALREGGQDNAAEVLHETHNLLLEQFNKAPAAEAARPSPLGSGAGGTRDGQANTIDPGNKAPARAAGEAPDASGDAAGGESPPTDPPKRPRRTKAEMEAARAAEAKPPKTAEEAFAAIEKAGNLGLGGDQCELMHIPTAVIEELLEAGRVTVTDEGRIAVAGEPAGASEPEPEPDQVAEIDAEMRAAAAVSRRNLDMLWLKKMPTLPPDVRGEIRARRSEYEAIALEPKS